MCWNGEEDSGTKTILVIRDASKKTQHHTIHTQPIGNRFDMVSIWCKGTSPGPKVLYYFFCAQLNLA